MQDSSKVTFLKNKNHSKVSDWNYLISVTLDGAI